MKKNNTIFMITMCSLFLSGCPQTTTVKLKNESQQPISFLYSNGHQEIIKPNRKKKVNYSFDCIRIKKIEGLYEYQPINPTKYTERKMYTHLLHAVFTEDNRLKVYDKNNPTDSIELEQGCTPRKVIKIKNDNSQPISIVFPENFLIEIESKSTVSRNYKGCLRIKSGEHIYEYNTEEKLPEKYTTVANFAHFTHIVFTEDNKLNIYNKGNPNDFMELEKGCQ